MLTLSAAVCEDGAPPTADDDRVDPDWCIVTIDDTGPGIAPEIVERIFNPFFTTRQSGTGLGLAIVHRIVDAHGGEIAVGRNREGGASIALRLPIVSRPAAAPVLVSPHA
jgi:signal transduction histidine kinase